MKEIDVNALFCGFLTMRKERIKRNERENIQISAGIRKRKKGTH